jgi:hypothetical protein
MADYTVELEWDRDSAKWKVAWCDRHYIKGFYFVSDQRLREYSEDVQTALQNLISAVRDQRKAEYPKFLRDVAAKGHDLYRAFFIGSATVYESEALRLKTWVMEKLVAQQDTITFCVRDRIHIPWGLFYDRDPGQQIDPGGFWCMKYNVGAHYFNCAADGVEREWHPDEFPLLFAAHEALWTEQFGATEVADKEWRNRLERLLRPIEQPRFLLDELVRLWGTGKNNAPYGLLTFYCHSNKKLLCIGEDMISASKFSDIFSRARGGNTPPTLVFLAGCETAVGDLDAGFLEETSGTGFCGFIGTEVKVPKRLTLEFLSDFLAEVYGSGGSVFKVMRDLRDKHWPHSLVFSMCCARDLRLKAPTAAASASQSEAERAAV